MPIWWDDLCRWLDGPAMGRTRPFRRRFRLSAPAAGWIVDARRSEQERRAMSEVLRMLDADPISSSHPVLNVLESRGMRVLRHSGLSVVFTFDPGRDLVRIADVRVVG